MARFSDVTLFYFVSGVMMYGGGALDFQEAGIATKLFTTEGGTFAPTGLIQSSLSDATGALDTLTQMTLGGIQLIMNLVSLLFDFLHWPVIALNSTNAPPMAVLLIGGSLVLAFYISIVGLFTRST